MPRHRRAGFTLPELLTALAVAGVVLSHAVPAFSAYVQRLRVRSALHQVSAEIHRARAVAARRGGRVVLRFRPPTGCAVEYELARADGHLLATVPLRDRTHGVCLTSNVPRALSINSRGMLVGSPRTLRAHAGTQSDSLTISIAGRVYHWD